MSALDKAWWSPLLRGVAAVLFGLLALFWPGISALGLILTFGGFAVVDGIMSLGAGVTEDDESPVVRLLYAGIGVVGIMTGAVVLGWSGITSTTLAQLIAFWAIITGALEIVAAFVSRNRTGRFDWLALAAGVVSAILGTALVLLLGAQAVELAWLIGAFAVIWGVMLVMAGFGMHAAVQEVAPRSDEFGEPARSAIEDPWIGEET